MSDTSMLEYYRSRAFKEREMAQAAISPAIIAIHLEMAERYLELAAKPASILQNSEQVSNSGDTVMA